MLLQVLIILCYNYRFEQSISTVLAIVVSGILHIQKTMNRNKKQQRFENEQMNIRFDSVVLFSLFALKPVRETRAVV